MLSFSFPSSSFVTSAFPLQSPLPFNVCSCTAGISCVCTPEPVPVHEYALELAPVHEPGPESNQVSEFSTVLMPTCEFPACPVSITEVILEHPACPVLTTMVTCEPSLCPVMAKDVIPESLAYPVTAVEAVSEFLVSPDVAKEAVSESLASPVKAMEAILEHYLSICLIRCVETSP